MNRNQEYLALMEELEKNVPDLKGSVKKARNRRFRHRFIFRPAAVLAVSFLLFVAAVNFSPAVAYACSLVPGLRELAAAVSFSRSLSDAVDHDYVQEVNLTQTRNDITVRIPYLIMDQKQVNVFYTIDSDRYGELEAEADVLKEDGTSSTDCGISSGSPFGNDGRLHSFNIEFYEEDVPEKLCFHMDVYTYDAGEAIELPLTDEMTDSLEDAFEISELTNQEGGKEEEAIPLAQFDFLLEIDSSLRSNGIILPVNHVLELNEQKITVRHVEVYPTHCRVELEEDPDNTAWLKGLDFSIETRVWGEKFESTGTAFGSENSNSFLSYRADSPYFYRARHMKLVIRGAEWQTRSEEKAWVNLKTGESSGLPPGLSFEEARRNGSGWSLAFHCTDTEKMTFGKPLFSDVYDEYGTEYHSGGMPTVENEHFDENGISTYDELIEIPDYPYDEVWFSPEWKESWTPEKEITVKVR